MRSTVRHQYIFVLDSIAFTACSRLPRHSLPGHSSPQAERVALPDLDLVLLSYEQMRKELSNPKASLLTRFGFWRIMLDEVRKVASAHVNTVSPRSCCVASP